MRSKAPLVLIEQVIMLLVFALAAALCLQAFVWAQQRSEQNAMRDRALIQAQSAAETMKYCAGDPDGAARLGGGICQDSNWVVYYDQNWEQTTERPVYLLQVTPKESQYDRMGAAVVEVLHGETCLARLTVNWQEVDGNG